MKGTKVRKAEQLDDDPSHTNHKHGKSNHSHHKEKDHHHLHQPHSRISKKKHVHGGASFGDASHYSEGTHSAHSHRNTKASSGSTKGSKKNCSKKCEEMVQKATTDFFDCAWLALSERFFISSAPVTVSYDLRNTWLRVVEVEWQDREITVGPYTRHNRIFKKDEAPLPLAFDSWAGGALEPMPSYRRESVLDPFLRDPETFQSPSTKHSPSLSAGVQRLFGDDSNRSSPTEHTYLADEESNVEKSEELQEETAKNTGNLLNRNTTYVPAGVVETKDDNWNFDLDQSISLLLEKTPEESFVSNQYNVESKSGESDEAELQHRPVSIHMVLSAKPLSLDESTTDVGYSSHRSSTSRRSEISGHESNQRQVKRFSPSQCGGNGSKMGVYRLPQETTYEAIFRREFADVLNSIKKGDTENSEENVEQQGQSTEFSPTEETSHTFNNYYVSEEPKLVVLPLFQERTPRAAASESLPRHPALVRHSHVKIRHNSIRENLYDTASEINSQFLKRTMLNLNNRLRRQTIRSLAARKVEKAARKYRQSTSSTKSRSSLISSSNRTNKASKTNRSNKRKGGNQSVNMGSSGSASDFDITKESGQSIFYTAIKDNDTEDVESESQSGHAKRDRKGRSAFKKMGNVRRVNHKFVERFSDKPTPAEFQKRFANARKSCGGMQYSSGIGNDVCQCNPLRIVSCDCQPKYETCFTVCVNKNDLP